MNAKTKRISLLRINRVVVLLLIPMIALMLVNPVQAGSMVGLDSFSYLVRQGWVYLDSSVNLTSATNNWTSGYLDIAVSSGGDSGDQLRILSSGSLSVVGDAVSWSGTRIGTIDPVRNGVNGQPLRINFSAALLNSGFESGNFSGWTVNTSFPGLPGDSHSGISQTATVQSSIVYAGSYAAQLSLTGNVGAPCGTAHGPEITSSTFYAQAGNTLSLQWNALDSGDDYDVYGYLENVSTGVSQQLFYGRGDNTGGWVTLNASIGSGVCPSGTCGLRFRFLAGSYDATCGQYVGSTMYIDGISVVTSTATDAAVDYIMEHVEYQNTSNTPNMSKVITVGMQDNSSYGSATANITLIKANTTTTITGISPEPSVYGQNYTVSVNVAAQSPSAGVPNGSVNVSDGLGNSCTASLTNGSGSCALPSNTLGARTISASYPGTSAYNSSTATSSSHTVNKANSTTTITSDGPDPSVFGQNYTVNVSVAAAAPGAGTPTGTVAVSDGLGNSCNATLSGGTGSCVLPSVSIASLTLTASYPGDTYFNASSDTEAHTVNKANSTTTITSDGPDASVYGQDYTVNVSVAAAAPGAGTPTGTVAVSDGVGNSCNVTLASGTGSCVLPSTVVGSRTLTASYAGNANFNASSDTEAHTINKAASTTTVTSDGPDPSVPGQDYTVEVSVAAAAPGAGTPTGTVAVSDGLGNSCNATLSGGTGSCSLPSAVVGSHTLSASYTGDVNFNASSTTEAHVIDKGLTETTIISDLPDPTVYGEAYVVDVEVTILPPATGILNGLVTVSDGLGNSCEATITNGAGNCTMPSTEVTVPTLTATFHENASFYGSETTAEHTINKADTTLALASSDDQSVYGQSITLTATASAVLPGQGTPTGLVQFYLDGAAYGSPVSLTAGSAQVTIPATYLLVGDYEFTAAYAGDANFNGSSSPEVDQIVERASTTVVVSSSENPSVYGVSLTMTITVTSNSPSIAIPNGSVQLFVDGIRFGSSLPLDSAGKATRLIPYMNLWPGSHAVTAVYTPASVPQFDSSNNNTSPLMQQVDKAQPVITIVPSVTSPIALETVTYTVTVGHSLPTQGTPSGTVQFYVDGNPLGGPVTLDAEGRASNPTGIAMDAGLHSITVGYSGDDYFYSVPTSHALEQTIALAPTTTQILSIDPANSVVGQPVAVAVQVTANAPSSGVPAGTVTVTDGFVNCTITLDVNGTGTCNLEPTSPTLPGEPLNLTATYSGAANFLGSVSAPFEGPSVDKANATVNLISFSPVTPVVGQTVIISFSVVPVAPGWGTPTGTVILTDGSGQTCTADLAVGECTFTFTQAGPASLVATYSGDANFYPAESAAIAGPVVAKANTSLAVVSSSATSVFGQPISFTATVSAVAPGSGTPTGLVQFKVDGVDYGSPIALSGNEAVSEELASLAVSGHTYSAEYLGDANYHGSVSAEENQTVIKADTSIALTSNLNPSPYGLPVLITATVTANLPSQAVPQSGTVQFIVDGIPYGAPVALNSVGQATKLLPYTALWVGTHPITAVYSGSVSFNGCATAEPLEQVIEKGDLTITLTTSVTDPVYGQDFSLSSTVIGNGSNNPQPTGTLQFVVDGVNIGDPVLLDSNSTAVSNMLSGLAAGAHPVQLQYSGDDYYAAKTVDIAQGIIVGRANTLPEITSISPDNPVVGQPMTVSFSVTAVAPGVGIPTGSVTITSGGENCTATLAVDGTGSCEIASPSAGDTTFTISYAGDANFNASAGADPVAGPTVSPASTTTTITDISPAEVVVGEAYTVSVLVTANAPSTSIPSGMVTISNGTDSCQAVLQPDGTASCSIIPTQAGVETVTARFFGMPDFENSVSTEYAGPMVNKADTSANLVSGMNPILVGGSVQFTATVQTLAPGSGTPAGMVQFKVDGDAYGAPVALVNGSALSPEMTDLTAGSHAVTVEYLGNDNYNESISAAITQRVVDGNLLVELIPGEPGVLVYSAIENGVPVSVTIQFPADSVNEKTTLILRRINPSLLTPLDGLQFVMNFTLEAYVNGELVPNFVFNIPATATVVYDQAGWKENSLVVRNWDGSQWSTEGITFVSQDMDTNTVVFTIAGTGFGEYALMGQTVYITFMPFVSTVP